MATTGSSPLTSAPPPVPVYNTLREPIGDSVGANAIVGVVNDAGGLWDVSSDPSGPTATRYPNLSAYIPATNNSKYILYRFHLKANDNITGNQVTTFALTPPISPRPIRTR